jgi:hypothetical protein
MNDHELESLLRGGAPVDDDGFTAKVVQQLPPPRKRAPRFAILLGATTLASGIAYLAAPNALSSLIEGVQNANSMAPFIVLGSVFAVLVGAAAQEAVRANA